jgi:hypothetical protein
LASEKVEISETEKRELVLRVYPRLKKRSRLMRMLRVGNAVLMAMLITACAATQPTVEKPDVSTQIKKGLVSGDNPAEYAKTMPESAITLSSIVRYTKQPTVKHIADGVTDMDYQSGLFALLKKDRLELNRVECPSILLPEDRYLSVQLEGDVALVTGSKKTLLVDVSQCGILHELESAGRGFSISDKYMLEFTPNSFELYDQKRAVKKQGGSFLGAVRMGVLSGDNIMFANENGKIAIMSALTGKYRAISPRSYDIQQIYYDESVFVYDTDNLLHRLSADYGSGELIEAGSAQAQDGCFFMKRSDMLNCEGYLFGLDFAYKLPAEAERGLVRDGLIFLLSGGAVNFVDTTLVYKKSVALAPAGKKLCLMDGRAFFRDFDGSVKYISAKGAEHSAEKMPDECDHSFDFKNGVLATPDGRVIYKYADVVNSSDKALMLKRVIGEDVYYYFEKLSD